MLPCLQLLHAQSIQVVFTPHATLILLLPSVPKHVQEQSSADNGKNSILMERTVLLVFLAQMNYF